MTGFDAGRVRLRLVMQGKEVVAVDVSCVRPDVAAALAGRAADEAVSLVPLIYSLCGQAQGIAARAALAAARGLETAPHVDARVAAEALREHAWKLLVDWPRAAGLQPDEALFVRVAKTTPGAGAALAGELREQPGIAGLRLAVQPQPGAAGAAGDGVFGERIAVRLAEACALLAGAGSMAGLVAATPQAPGRGRATVETARGELVHELALDGDRIACYRIVAPTDRLFAGDGPLPALLLGRPPAGAGDVTQWVGRIVMALDPCVPWELELA